MKDNLEIMFAKKEYRFSKAQVSLLGKDDLKSVQRIFKTAKDLTEFQKAMNILLIVNPTRTKRLLLTIVLNPEEDEAKQITAVNGLNGLNGLNELSKPNDERYYLKGLSNNNLAKGVEYRLIQGLGKFGSLKSVELLEEKRHSYSLTEAATLSILLIKGRYGLKNDFVFDISPTPIKRKIKREKRSPMALRKRKFEITEDYGMKLSNSGHEIECGRALLTFVLNTEFHVEDTSRTQLAGLITAKFEESSKVFSKYIIVFDQNRIGQNQVLVFRNDGVLSYGGIVKPDGSFMIECTRKSASDLAKVHGKIAKGKLKFTSHETATERVHTKFTQKLVHKTV